MSQPGDTHADDPAGRPQVQCCGTWVDYPSAGHDTQCPTCHSTFTVADTQAGGGAVPDLGAVRSAEVLTGLLGIPVSADGIAELARLGLIPVTGHYKGFPLYDRRALDAFTDTGAAAEATRAGRLRTADEAAAYLSVRRADLDHLTRAGLLAPAKRARGPFDRRGDRSVALYRTADLDALTTTPADLDGLAAALGIDWDAVRATPKGRRSPLASLPSAPGQRPGRRRRKTWQDGPDAYRCQPAAAGPEGGDQDMTTPGDTWT